MGPWETRLPCAGPRCRFTSRKVKTHEPPPRACSLSPVNTGHLSAMSLHHMDFQFSIHKASAGQKAFPAGEPLSLSGPGPSQDSRGPGPPCAPQHSSSEGLRHRRGRRASLHRPRDGQLGTARSTRPARAGRLPSFPAGAPREAVAYAPRLLASAPRQPCTRTVPLSPGPATVTPFLEALLCLLLGLHLNDHLTEEHKTSRRTRPWPVGPEDGLFCVALSLRHPRPPRICPQGARPAE